MIKRIIYSMMIVSAVALTSGAASAGHIKKHHGLSHVQVQAIQQGLHDAGYYDDAPVDGLWGPVTTRAMASFQYNKGLKPTGFPDGESLKKLGVNTPVRGQDVSKFSQ